MIAFSSTAEILISDSLKRLYVNRNMSGLKGFEPVEIVSVKARKKIRQARAPLYYKVRPIIGRTAVDDVKSELIRAIPAPCHECRLGGTIQRFERVIVEEGSWSGEDVFVARGLLGTMLVTSRFEELCRINGMKNANFIPANAYHHSIDDMIEF